MAPLERFRLRRIRSEILGQLHGRVLDVGVGTGANLGLYAPDARVTAIDVDPGMLARAAMRPEAAGVELLRMDAERLDLDDKSFDVVLSTLVFCGVSKPERALAEVYRVLVPGGKLVMIEHTLGPSKVLNAILRGLSAWLGPRYGEYFDRPIARLVDGAGFASVSNRMLALGTFQLIEGIRPLESSAR